MSINKKKITKEMLLKAAECKSADELIALAKKAGVEVTKAEAEAYLAEVENIELKSELLEKIAGDIHCGAYCLDLETDSGY